MRRGNFKFYEGFAYWTPGWKGVVGLLFWLLVGALLGNGVTLAFQKLLGYDAAMEYGTLLAYPVMFIPPMVYARVKSMKREMDVDSKPLPLNEGHFAPVGGVLCALLVVLMTLTAGYMTDAITSVMPAMPQWLADTLKNMTGGNVVVDLICVSVFAPICEEWLCRGMVLRGLLGKGVKPVWAIIFSAFFFALIHANPWQAVPAFILGCLFGYVYWKTGSLWMTMLMHCVNNTLAVVLGQIDSLKEMETWQDVLSPEIYWSLFAAFALLLILCIRKISRIDVVDSKNAGSVA